MATNLISDPDDLTPENESSGEGSHEWLTEYLYATATVERTSASIADPDGGSTASELQLPSIGNEFNDANSFLRQSKSFLTDSLFTTDGEYRFDCNFKLNTGYADVDQVSLQVELRTTIGTLVARSVAWDLNSGTQVGTGGSALPNEAFNIEDRGSGWYRVSIDFDYTYISGTPDGIQVVIFPVGNGAGTSVPATFPQRVYAYEPRVFDRNEDSQVTVEKSYTSKSGQTVYNAVCDRQDNVYVLDGNRGVEKLNSELTSVWNLSVPTKDQQAEILAIALDDVDHLYLGVTRGAQQGLAELIQYRPDPNGGDIPVIGWRLHPGGFVTDVEFKNGYLHVTENDDLARKGWLSVYSNLYDVEPALEWRRPIPYPCVDLAVKPNGETVTSHPPWPFRGTLNDALAYGEPAQTEEEWTPWDLDDAPKRIWSWFRADDLNGVLDDGDQVTFWPDRSGNERHLFQSTDHDPPTLNKLGFNGRSGVQFDGTQALVSLANSAVKTAQGQRSILPGYENAMFCVVMVVKCLNGTTAGCILSRDNDDSGEVQRIKMNAQDADGYGSATEYKIAIQDADDGSGAGSGEGDGTDGNPDSDSDTDSDFDNDLSVAVITFLCDGSVTTGTYDNVVTHSVMRVNGHAVDRWTSSTIKSAKPVFVGVDAGSGSDYGEFELLEMIVLRDKDVSADESSAETILSHPRNPDAGTSEGTSTEMHELEGWLFWRYGTFNLAETNQSHAWDDAPPDLPQYDASSNPGPNVQRLQDTRAIIAKWGLANGDLIWMKTESDSAGGDQYKGLGGAVAIDHEGNVVCAGAVSVLNNGLVHGLTELPTNYRGSGTVHIEKLIDSGADVSAADASAWQQQLGPTDTDTDKYWSDYYTRIAVDEFGNIYIPFHWNASHADSYALSLFTTAGTEVARLRIETGASTGSGKDQRTFAIALPQSTPTYDEDDFSAGDPRRKEFVFAATANESYDGTQTGLANIHKVKLVDAAKTNAAPRTLVNLLVNMGDIKSYDTSTASVVTGGDASVDGEFGLDSNARYVSCVVMYGRAYFTDGVRYTYYDPIEAEAFQFKAAGAGVIKPRGQLFCRYAGRLFIANFADSPHEWIASKYGEPDGWDRFPPVPTATQAIYGTNALAGAVPDIINCLFSYKDDLLIFGCDSSIFRLTGDPLRGGSLDLVTDETGIAFGRPITLDPRGNLIFFGSRGGVYIMPPAGEPEPFYQGKLPRELENVDLGDYRIGMVWNYKDRGLHVYQMPYGMGGTIVNQWFWKDPQPEIGLPGGWWPDQFADTTLQPTAIWQIDGDDYDDRDIVIGTEDGHVLKMSPDYNYDGAFPVDAYVDVGPFQVGSAADDVKLAALTAYLADNQSGCNVECYVSDTTEVQGEPVWSGELRPGWNPTQYIHRRGRNVFLRFRNAAANERFALEEAIARVHRMGRAMVRPR